MTTDLPREAAFIATRAHGRFVEFADACSEYRYIGVCHGRPGVGKTRSAREYAAWPGLSDYSFREPPTGTTADAVRLCRGLFYTAAVANTPKSLQAGLGLNLARLGHARLVLDGQMGAIDRMHQAERACPLVVVDEADRLSLKSLEHLRDLYDRYGFGLILLGMPGLEKRLARYPQFFSRIGFVHEFKPLGAEETRVLLARHGTALGVRFDPESLEHVEALAAVIRITSGNLRLIERLLAQMRRIMALNPRAAVSVDLVQAARD
ncbi:ATP-binding protein, partial [Rubellimicrobium rubrum]